MAELKITKARLDLLRAVDRDHVTRSRFFPYDCYRSDTRRTVTVALKALRDAGLVEIVEGRDSRWSKPFSLTDAGRAVLAGGGE